VGTDAKVKQNFSLFNPWQRFAGNRCHNKSRKKLATFFKFRRLFYSGEIPSGHGSHSKISVTVHRPDAFVRE
jgi:hypothetical protein